MAAAARTNHRAATGVTGKPRAHLCPTAAAATLTRAWTDRRRAWWFMLPGRQSRGAGFPAWDCDAVFRSSTMAVPCRARAGRPNRNAPRPARTVPSRTRPEFGLSPAAAAFSSVARFLAFLARERRNLPGVVPRSSENTRETARSCEPARAQRRAGCRLCGRATSRSARGAGGYDIRQGHSHLRLEDAGHAARAEPQSRAERCAGHGRIVGEQLRRLDRHGDRAETRAESTNPAASCQVERGAEQRAEHRSLGLLRVIDRGARQSASLNIIRAVPCGSDRCAAHQPRPTTRVSAGRCTTSGASSTTVQ